jgi:hypothetical protein
MRGKQFRKGASKFSAPMAMRTEFAAQIMNQIWTRGFFSCSGRDSFYAPNIRCANNWRVISRKVLFDPHRFLSNKSPIHFAGESGKGIRFSMENGMFKIKMDIDRHGPRRMPDNCKNLNPPYFSLPSTFNDSKRLSQVNAWCLEK